LLAFHLKIGPRGDIAHFHEQPASAESHSLEPFCGLEWGKVAKPVSGLWFDPDMFCLRCLSAGNLAVLALRFPGRFHPLCAVFRRDDPNGLTTALLQTDCPAEELIVPRLPRRK
jgi:hypothetical protein